MNISILVASYNTKDIYITECINSIKNQKNIENVKVEVVWINDGSDKSCSTFLEQELKILTNMAVVYKKFNTNKGLSYCLHEGVKLCTNEIIFRMDSDDIMHELRIRTQLDFMNRIGCEMCGTNILCFTGDNKKIIDRSNHPDILTWDEYKIQRKMWILNHPTLCFKKSAILEVGNYNKDLKLPFEDLDLELRVLKKYGTVYNIKEPLLYYRIHNEQVTQKNSHNSQVHDKIKQQMISDLI